MIRCPACQSKDTDFLFDMGLQPLSLVDMQDDPDKSAELEKHPIRLRICHNCCHVYNEAFDPTVEQYDGAGCRMYNNGSSWQEHMAEVKKRIESLMVSTVVEIGAGDCSFLKSLAMLPGSKKIAVDPCEAVEVASDYGIGFYREYFSAYYHIPEDAGSTLIVMRHLLEHMDDPRHFLEEIVKDNLRRRPDNPTWMYIEVPCAKVALENCRVEDWTYEHPQHFTETSMQAMLGGLGLAFNLWPSYGDEVLCCLVYLPPAMGKMFDSDEIVCNYDRVGKLILKVADWIDANADNIVLWGGAGKSAMFLNLLTCRDDLTVVDSHDMKWGMYVPGTRLRIQNPAVITLRDKPPTIIATTSWRAGDIAAEIVKYNIPCERLLKFANGQLVEVPLG